MKYILAFMLIFSPTKSFADFESAGGCTKNDLVKFENEFGSGSDLYAICSAYISDSEYNDVKSDLIAIYSKYYAKTGDPVFSQKIDQINEFEVVANRYNFLDCALKIPISGHEPLPKDECSTSFYGKEDTLIQIIEEIMDNPPNKNGEEISIDKFQPSFNCKMSSYNAEKMICKSSVLSKIDMDLSKIYNEKINSTNKQFAEKIKSDQIKFISIRNKCDSWVCVRDEMIQRISDLKDIK